MNRVSVGPLRASGDTRWSLYGTLLGLHAFALLIAYTGVVTPLGVVALYLTLLVETAVPVAVTYYRFQTGQWKVISRALRSDAPE